MYIKKILINNKKNIEEVPCQTVQDAINIIKQLDGKEKSQIILQGEGRFMQIGGPKDSRYLVFVAIDNKGLSVLTDPTKPEDKMIKITMAGHPAHTSQRQSADLNLVMKAVKEFAASGELSESLAWVSQ